MKINLNFAGFSGWNAGKIAVNTERTNAVNIENNSADSVLVRISLLNGIAFSLPGKTIPYTTVIFASAGISLDLSFLPQTQGIFEDSLIVESLEPCIERFAFYLRGEGYVPISPKYKLLV